MKKVLLFSILALLMGSQVVQVQAQKKTAARARTSVLPNKRMALQLYSIGSVIGDYSKTHETIFKQLASFGITDVEAAGYNCEAGTFYGVSPEQYKADLAVAGLRSLSSHSSHGLSDEELKNHDFTAAMKWYDKAIADHVKAGCKYMVCPGMRFPKDLTEAQTLCDYHNAIGAKCRAAGLQYGFHTHSGEYDHVGGKDGPIWIEYMMNHIDPANMFWQMDVYWCVIARQSPVEWFKKFPGRFKLLHIKDKYDVGASGMIGFDAIFKNAGLAGLQNYVLELEGTDGTMDIMEAVRRSAQYIRSSKFVKTSYSTIGE